MGSGIADLIFVVIGLSIVAVCYHRGLLKIALRSCSLLLAVLIAYWFGGYVSGWFYDHLIGNMVYNSMHETVSQIYAETAGQLNIDQLMEQIPSFLHTEELRNSLETLGSSDEEWIHAVTSQLSAPVASLISNILAYLLVFAAAWIALFFLSGILNAVIGQIPLLDRVNKLLGAVWGILVAGSLMLIVASLIKLFFAETPLYADSVVIRFFGDSALLRIFSIFDVGNLFLNSTKNI